MANFDYSLTNSAQTADSAIKITAFRLFVEIEKMVIFQLSDSITFEQSQNEKYVVISP